MSNPQGEAGHGDGPTDHLFPKRDAGDPGDLGETTVWQSLTREPHTGVTVLQRDGKIAYVNEQAVEIYYGSDMAPDQAVGKSLADVQSPEFSDERHGFVHRVLDEDRPLLIREFWRGRQHLSWALPAAVEDVNYHEQKVLIVTRRMGGDAKDQALTHNRSEQVDAEVVDLGEFDVLSHRELVVLALLGRGLSLKQTAGMLHRSIRTIESQRDSIGLKLKLRSRGEIVRLVERVGLTIEDAHRLNVS